ncbi:hypothetical protein P7K49_003402 [Saguinus oedipus]|uniref:Uncharacterized protein n=1 Tax=Saguinus oedipus TaxID=9490 RepID=A0ABQ9W4H5_SAGOE|nr:hypothetical protein P7K49_003402 [Saguinus oedipus]
MGILSSQGTCPGCRGINKRPPFHRCDRLLASVLPPHMLSCCHRRKKNAVSTRALELTHRCATDPAPARDFSFISCHPDSCPSADQPWACEVDGRGRAANAAHQTIAARTQSKHGLGCRDGQASRHSRIPRPRTEPHGPSRPSRQSVATLVKCHCSCAQLLLQREYGM